MRIRADIKQMRKGLLEVNWIIHSSPEEYILCQMQKGRVTHFLKPFFAKVKVMWCPELYKENHNEFYIK